MPMLKGWCTSLKKSKRGRMATGCFMMLAIGTLPNLFINPLEYLMGLGFCLLTSVALAYILY